MKNSNGTNQGTRFGTGSGRPSLYRAAAALLLVFLLATGVFTGYYARMNFGRNDTASAETASFDITQEGIYSTAINSPPISPGMTVRKTLKITNRSETAMDCTLRLVNATGNIPLIITLENNGTTVQGSQTGNVYTNTVRLEPESGITEYDIVLYWPADNNSESYSGMVDYIKITLEAVQAQ